LITSIKAAYESKDRETRIKLGYTIFFTVFASVGGGSVFATTYFGNIPPYLLIMFSIYPAISVYAIFRHKLFNAKLIATEVLLFSLWIFIFIRILLGSSPKEQIANLILLIVSILIGMLLIRSVEQEVQQRQKIESLAHELKESNNQLEKANVRLKELDQMKTEFVSLATHQIRSPLTAIKGYISMVEEGDYGPYTEQIGKVLDIILASTNNLVTIVGDFLDVSRIEQGRMKYDYSDFDVKDLIEEVVREYRPNVEKRGLKLETVFAEVKSSKTHGDRGKIKQVIGNIIDNSIKYTPEGHIDVSIANKGNDLIIKISDTGVGIPAGTIPKLFQKFTRAENANETNILGTGLGLYVAKNLIEAMGGKVWAESEGQGRGAQFYIELTTI
jgi:signal transduction histidine kinase